MLNDALNSSFSPAGQKSFNKRLKELENKIDGYDESIKTGAIVADNGEITNLKSENIETENLKVNVDAEIENLKFNTAKGNEADIASVKASNIEAASAKFDSVEAASLSSTDAAIENIESSGTINANEVNAVELAVEKIIDRLNIHNLEIDNKKALNSLAEAVLQVGTGYKDAAFNSENRPKWKEQKIVTEEQLTTPFNLKGVVSSQSDLPPVTANEGVPNIGGQTAGSKVYTIAHTTSEASDKIFEWAGDASTDFLADWYWDNYQQNTVKARIDNALTAESSLVGEGIEEGNAAYIYDTNDDLVTEHECSRVDDNDGLINYGTHWVNGQNVPYNYPTVPIGGGSGEGAEVGDVYVIENGNNPQVAICVPGESSGGQSVTTQVEIDPFVTDRTAINIANVSKNNKSTSGSEYRFPGGARSKDVADGALCKPKNIDNDFTVIQLGQVGSAATLNMWAELQDYVESSGYSPAVAIEKYAQANADDFKTNVITQWGLKTGTFNPSRYSYNDGYLENKVYFAPKTSFAPTAIGDTMTDNTGATGYYVLVTDFNPNYNNFTIALAGWWASLTDPSDVAEVFSAAKWTPNASVTLEFNPVVYFNSWTYVAAPGADDTLTGQNYIDSVIGKKFIANVRTTGGDATWFIIPFPVLQMYRTAADQNAIDNQIHENIMEIRTWQEAQDHRITTNEHAIADNKAAQDEVNEQVSERFDATEETIAELGEQVESKISDAPANGKVYGRKNHAWVDVAADGMYVPKVYNKVEKFFTNITLKKDPSYVNTSQLVEMMVAGSLQTYYIGLWHLQPAETGDLAYTTKNAYDFAKEHQDILNEAVYQGIVSTFEAGHVLGTLDNITYQTLDWNDIEVEFDAEKPGDNIERPDGATLGVNRITSNDDGIDINSDIGFKANTPSPAADSRSVINRQYIDDNVSLSTSSSSSGASGAILEFKHKEIDLVSGRAWCFQPNCQLNLPKDISNDWYRRCKDYVYYKVDNSVNQSASSFSFWFSVDKNGNVINMTNPREDKGNAVANQSDFETWLTFSPELWEEYPETANVAYWPHANPDYAGYITMFDDGRFKKYVEDSTGVSNSIYTCTTYYYEYRGLGGKSLKGSPRMLIINNGTDTDSVKAGIIGIDSNNVEGLDKFKPVTLPLRVKHGFRGVAAGKKHWFAQQNTSNTFMVISGNGTVASYVLSDPVTQVALGTTVQNAQENYIELANGDAIFCVKDYSTDIMYHIYCHDNFEDEGVDPFTVYRSAIDFSSAANDGWPCCKGFPYVEFGDYVYFFPTVGADLGGSNAWLVSNTMASQYSRFNKSTKTWSDATLPWNNSGYGGVVPLKTYDPIEDKDYLWIFQSQQGSTAASPCQAQVVVISENGAIQYVDLGTGTTIHWFDNTARSGETLIGGYSRPLNISGDISWGYAQTVRGNIPYAAVTQQGIGIMVSNAARDVCVFYGNCHFAIYSYDNANEGGPWSYFSPDSRRGPSFIGGKYGAMLYVTFNNSIDLVEQDSSYGCIYIKPTGDDYLGEPQYFWKPTSMDYIRMWREKYDGADWAKTDFSDYRKEGLTTVTPAAGGWEATIGMANVRIEDIPASSTLYLKDGDNVISSVNLGGN